MATDNLKKNGRSILQELQVFYWSSNYFLQSGLCILSFKYLCTVNSCKSRFRFLKYYKKYRMTWLMTSVSFPKRPYQGNKAHYSAHRFFCESLVMQKLAFYFIAWQSFWGEGIHKTFLSTSVCASCCPPNNHYYIPDFTASGKKCARWSFSKAHYESVGIEISH